MDERLETPKQFARGGLSEWQVGHLIQTGPRAFIEVVE
jgi:hypothetical protein